jgi:hypothetical protein
MSGRQLLAHELSHVVQQSRGGTTPGGAPDSQLEASAEQAASAVMAGHGPVQVSGASAVGIACQPDSLSEFFRKRDKGQLYPHTVVFRNLDEFVVSEAGDPVFHQDGTITGTVWRPYPEATLTPPPVVTPRKPVPKPKPPPKREPPTDPHLLLEIAESLQPKLIYPKPVRHFFGALQFVGGGLEAGIGGIGGIATSETGVGLLAGSLVFLHGTDVATSGWHMMLTGESAPTYTFMAGAGLALAAGADPKMANAVGQSAELIAAIGSAGLTLSMPIQSPALALTPEAELDLELGQLADLSAQPRFSVGFDLKWQDIDAGVLTPEGYQLNPKLQNLESLLDPSGKLGGKTLSGNYMYVVDDQGAVYIGTRAGQHMPHPTLIGGEDPTVLAAGEIDIRGGRIYSINNLSGHFQPSPQSLGTMYRAFSRLPDTAFRRDFQGFRVFYF